MKLGWGLALAIALAGCGGSGGGSDPDVRDTMQDTGLEDEGPGPDTGTYDDPGFDSMSPVDIQTDVPGEDGRIFEDPGPGLELPSFLGGDRPAAIHVPSDYDPVLAWPLLILLHGYSVNGFVQDVYLGISQRVDKFGFIEVIPEGTVDLNGSQFWNAFESDFYPGAPDDAGYLLALIEEAKEVFHVDEDHVVMVGHSNGAFMAYRMACDHADVVTAIAPIAGMFFGDLDDCIPSQTVAVLHIHGTADAAVNYQGGSWHESYAGVDPTIDHWAAVNGCLEVPVQGDTLDYDESVNGPETLPSVWPDCDPGAGVELWAMEGSGHIPTFTDAFKDDLLHTLLEKDD